MKKVFRILLIFSILCVSGCDFLRRVAGRPTSAELQEKAAKLEDVSAREAEKKVETDSTALLEAEIEAALQELSRMNVDVSSVFGYGKPVKPVQNRYNIIAGVFRNAGSAEKLVQKAASRGYGSYLITFAGGVNAVCLSGGDSPAGFPQIISTAKKEGLCPSDTWIYLRKD